LPKHFLATLLAPLSRTAPTFANADFRLSAGIRLANTVSIDKAGRIDVPKPLREKLGLKAGDNLLIESDGDEITLRLVHPEPILIKEYGIWVYNGAPSHESIPDRIDREREKRVREFF